MQTAKTAITLLAALLSADVLAQGDEETPREYNVEIIVFVYEEDVSVGNEVFIPEPSPEVTEVYPNDPDTEMSFDPLLDDEMNRREVPGNEEAEPRAPSNRAEESGAYVEGISSDDSDALPDFVITPVDQLGMTDIIDKLERLDAYNPVLHAAWTQQALPPEQSITMDLSMLTEPPKNLSGSFKLYLSRFLHLMVDLTLDNDTLVPIAIEVPGSSLFINEESRRQPGVVHYTIDDDRIFKNGDTRYFDHPKFGVVARVTRVEEPEEDELSGDVDFLDDVPGDEVVE